MSLKIVIIGDSGVGKTAILERYMHGNFIEGNNATFSVTFKSKEVPWDDKGGTVKINLWDTAGQERYDALTKMYFKGADAALIVYDITDEISFEKARKWNLELDNSQQNKNETKIVKYLVGNKCDKVEKQVVKFKNG